MSVHHTHDSVVVWCFSVAVKTAYQAKENPNSKYPAQNLEKYDNGFLLV
jgi:hypothetical protein